MSKIQTKTFKTWKIHVFVAIVILCIKAMYSLAGGPEPWCNSGSVCIIFFIYIQYIQIYTKVCVRGIHLLFRLVPESTVAPYVTVDEVSNILTCILIKISLTCDKSVTTQNLASFIYWYWKKRLQMHF